MFNLYNKLSQEDQALYKDEFKELFDKYLVLTEGAIRYRKNITIPHYIKRNIQKYNIKFKN